MSFWKTLKELIFGPPLKEQFEQIMAEVEAKEEVCKPKVPAPVCEQITDSVTQTTPAKPKRARAANGRLKGDDKSTPDVNEAWEGGKAPAKKPRAPRKKKQ